MARAINLIKLYQVKAILYDFNLSAISPNFKLKSYNDAIYDPNLNTFPK